MKSAVTHYTRVRNGKTERIGEHKRRTNRGGGKSRHRGTKTIGWSSDAAPGIKLVAGTAGTVIVVTVCVILEMTIGLLKTGAVVLAVAAVVLAVLLGTKRGKKMVRGQKRKMVKRAKAKLYPKTRFSAAGKKRTAAKRKG